jgi:signal peptidase
MKKLFLIIPIIIALSLMIIPYVVYSNNFIMYQNTDSMYPAILPGDLLIVEYSEINDVMINDIIAFETHSEGVEVLVRRVIDASSGTDGIFGVDTKGDDKDFHDPWTIYSDGYIGKVVEINPPMGITLSNYFIFPLVIIIVICAVLFTRELLPKKGMELEELTCLRCGNKWFPRVINGVAKIPSTCPKKECRSPYWKTPRKTDK